MPVTFWSGVADARVDSDCVVERLSSAGDHDDVRSAPHEALGDGTTDPHRASGDDGPLPEQWPLDVAHH